MALMSRGTDSKESQPSPTVDQAAGSPKVDETYNVSEAESSKRGGSIETDILNDKPSAADEKTINFKWVLFCFLTTSVASLH